MSRQIKFSLNIGTEDQSKFAIPNGPGGGPPREGDVLTVDDEEAQRLCNLVECCTEVRAELPAQPTVVAEEETPRQSILKRKKDGEMKEASI